MLCRGQRHLPLSPLHALLGPSLQDPERTMGFLTSMPIMKQEVSVALLLPSALIPPANHGSEGKG